MIKNSTLSAMTYQPPPGAYDEAFTSVDTSIHGERSSPRTPVPRAHWKNVWEHLEQIGAADLEHRTALASHLLDENGATYGAPAGAEGAQERLWKLDLIPMILDTETFQQIERGIAQRAQVFRATIADLYGEQRLLHEGIIPPEVLLAHTGYMHFTQGLHSLEKSLSCYAVELARSAEGTFWVMADRSDAPVGLGFGLENRIVTLRALPHIFQNVHIRKLSPFFAKLKDRLRALSPRKVDHPRIVLLTGGPGSRYYFEDVYLARYLGYDLAQGSDLAVREDQVSLKTLAGLINVDVILMRGSEAELDPVECGGGAPHGVPGLMQAIRVGNVATANLPGAGIIESPVFMAVLPQLCQYFLNETLLIPSIATWWCQQPESLKYVLENLASLVIKPAFRASGGEEIIGPELTSTALAELRQQIIEKPYRFVAQELITRSAAPMLGGHGELLAGHIAMRAFAVADEDDYCVMPGGLVRVAGSIGPMELSIAGGDTSKDLWVLSDEPDKSASLLRSQHRNVELKRTTAKFPSRVADDLFWLGQAIEHSDILARMIRSLLSRIEDTGEFDNDTEVLLRALADVGGIEPGFAMRDFAQTLPQLPDAIVPMIADRNQINGLSHSVSELLRLSSLVRDWISPETWQQLQRASSDFLALLGIPVDRSALADDLDQLILSLASGMGLIENGMIRGPAWRFLDMGRRIERTRLSAAFVLSVLSSQKLQQTSTLKMVIEFSDCQMTYRNRYLDDIQQNAVFDLCITDVSNPRSILYQLERIAEHVEQLPNATQDPLRNDEKRFAMAAVHQTRMLTSDELGALEPKALSGVLKAIESSMRELSTLIERKYLLHSGAPRQIADTGEVVA